MTTERPLTEQAAELVASIQHRLDADDSQLRALGIDPELVRSLGERLPPDQRARAEAAFRADMTAIEEEVAAARAQLEGPRAQAGKARSAGRFV